MYKILKILNFLLLMVLLFDPIDKILKINKIISILIVLVYLIHIKFNKEKIKKKYIYFYIFYFLLPVMYAILILFFNKNINIDIYYIKQNIIRVIFGVILFPLSVQSKKELLKNFIVVLRIYAIFILFVFILKSYFLYFNHSDLNKLIYNWGIEKEIFYFELQYINKIKIPSIFSRNILTIIFLLAFSLFNKKRKTALLSFFILCQSGTAANVLSAFLVVFYYIYSKFLKTLMIRTRFFLFNILGFLGIVGFKDIIFNSKDTGNTIKYLHMISYFEYWKNNPKKFLFGNGLGTGIYTKAYNKFVYLTEIFYFEIIRIYGVIIFCIILYFFIKILLKCLNKKDEWLVISYLSYLCICGTNPYLFGVMGTFIICFIFSYLWNRGD